MLFQATDEQLMLRYAKGDVAAFERLYAQHKGPLYRFCLRQIGTQQAEEIAQEIWLNIINARERYQASAKFTTYLYGVARNRIIDHVRRNTNRDALTDNSVNSDCDVVVDPGATPDVEAEQGEIKGVLMRALASLPLDQKEAFLLKEEAGLSVVEIAQVTGNTVEAIKSRVRYAVAKIRAAIDEAGV